jgi:hypothetical protein
MSLAHKIATHDHDFEGDVLAQIQRFYEPQEGFLVPTWFYRQACWIEESASSENALYNTSDTRAHGSVGRCQTAGMSA